MKLYGTRGPLTLDIYTAAFDKFKKDMGIDSSKDGIQFDIRTVALMAHVDHICERGIAIEFS
jgi:hypothetical protein